MLCLAPPHMQTAAMSRSQAFLCSKCCAPCPAAGSRNAAAQHPLGSTVCSGPNSAASNHYEHRFPSPSRLQWQSQTRTTQNSGHGQILSGQLPGYRVHLFVRSEKLRGKTAAPFLYLGVPGFSGWEGEAPIAIDWDLPEPVPQHFRKVLRVP